MHSNWTRRRVLGTATGTAMLAGMPAILRGAEPEALADSLHGKLRGAREKGVCVFRGIPYGGEVSSPANRF